MINRIIKKLLHFWKKNDPLSHYIKNGNIVIGKNSKIQNINIYIAEPVHQTNYITIGDDCMISGSIMIYDNEARVVIGDRVYIGTHTTLFCKDKIIIGNDVMISWGCTLIDTNAHSLRSRERLNDVTDWMKGAKYKNWNHVETNQICIEDNSWLGFDSIVTKGVVIKKGSVIGCGSVVTKSTEEFSVYGGNPAFFIKKTD